MFDKIKNIGYNKPKQSKRKDEKKNAKSRNNQSN